MGKKKKEFYGPKEVLKKEVDGDNVLVTLKTPDGDDEVIQLSQRMAKNVFTDKPIDYTDLGKKRLDPIVEDILSLLLMYDIEPKSEINYVVQMLATSFNENFDKAVGIKFGCENHQIKMSHIDKTLKDGKE